MSSWHRPWSSRQYLYRASWLCNRSDRSISSPPAWVPMNLYLGAVCSTRFPPFMSRRSKKPTCASFAGITFVGNFLDNAFFNSFLISSVVGLFSRVSSHSEKSKRILSSRLLMSLHVCRAFFSAAMEGPAGRSTTWTLATVSMPIYLRISSRMKETVRLSAVKSGSSARKAFIFSMRASRWK